MALLALGRPLLTSVNTVAGVAAAEETDSGGRSAAIALVDAAYAVGAGLLALVRGAAAGILGFQGVFLLAAVPLALMPVAGRLVGETARFRALSIERVDRPAPPRIGNLRGRLAVVCALHLGVGLVTGPVNGYLFLYGQSVPGIAPRRRRHRPRWAADRALGRRPGGAPSDRSGRDGCCGWLWPGRLRQANSCLVAGSLPGPSRPRPLRPPPARWTPSCSPRRSARRQGAG